MNQICHYILYALPRHRPGNPTGRGPWDPLWVAFLGSPAVTSAATPTSSPLSPRLVSGLPRSRSSPRGRCGMPAVSPHSEVSSLLFPFLPPDFLRFLHPGVQALPYRPPPTFTLVLFLIYRRVVIRPCSNVTMKFDGVDVSISVVDRIRYHSSGIA
jgi:hypothetical protein